MMNNMGAKHTPGLWYTVISPQMKKAYIGAKRTHYIIELLTHEWDFEETEANARLIAAAPEMLDLLIKVEEHLSSTNATLRSSRKKILQETVAESNDRAFYGCERQVTQEGYNTVAECHSKQNREEYELLISVRELIKKINQTC